MALASDAAPTPRQLLALFTRLGSVIAAAPTTDDGLAAITAAAANEVPGVDFASISRYRGDHFQTLAPTEPAATAADRLQYQLGSGPCVAAATTDTVYRSGDITTDDRWPDYGPRAFAQFGVRSMLSVHLVLDDDDITASLNLYSRTAHAFIDDDTTTTATLLAVYGTTALSRLIAHNQAAHLTTALINARVIGIAMGVLMTTHKITTEQAFDLLRITSQHTNRKLADIAHSITEQGSLPDYPTPPATT